MNALSHEIDVRTRAFAREIAELVRSHALAALQQTLAASPAAALAPTRKPGRKSSKVAVTKAPSRSPTDGRLTRRSPEELAKLTDRLLGQIAARPGARMETLRAALDVPTNLLAGPIAKLLAAGSIRKEGEKRATRYYVVDDAGTDGAKSRKAKGK